MRQFNKFRNTRGFLSAWERAVRFRAMRNQQEVGRRARILTFRERYGNDAAGEAFGVSRRTLYRWFSALRRARGNIAALDPRSTAPKRRRARDVPGAVRDRIVALRAAHPRLGKEKVHTILAREGYAGSVSTIGRILGDLRKQGRLSSGITLSFAGRTGNLIERRPAKRRKKLRRPPGYRVLEVDTVVRFIDGVKRYVLTGIDTKARTAFAGAYTNHGSSSAADFLRKAVVALPDCPGAVQTDNGSEFARHFAAAAAELRFTHFHTYPRSPKMNAHVERFNRTLNEEFLRSRRGLLRDDVRAFNEELVDWLLWYNGERPHHALGQRSPFRCMMEGLSERECQMWWTHTIP